MCEIEMSIYDTGFSNGLDIRTRATKTDKLEVLNPETQQYERILPGGGGGEAVLPYWVKPEKILFDDYENAQRSSLDRSDLVFYDGVDSETLNLVSLRTQRTTLAAVTDVILPAHEASLDELDGRVATNTTAVATLAGRVSTVEATNVTQGTSISSVVGKTANVTQNGATSLVLGYTNTGGTRCLINSAGLHTFSGASTSTLLYPHVKIDATSIAIVTSPGASVYLDAARVDNVAKLASVSNIEFNTRLDVTKALALPAALETVDTSSKSMLVLDASTKIVSYAPIPSGTAGALNRCQWVSLTAANCYTDAALTADSASVNLTWPFGGTIIKNIDVGSSELLKFRFEDLDSTIPGGETREYCIFIKDGVGLPTNVNAIHYEWTFQPNGNAIRGYNIRFRAHRRTVQFFTNAPRTTSGYLPAWILSFENVGTDDASINGTIEMKRFISTTEMTTVEDVASF